MVNKLKENWNAVDEKCSSCGQVTKKAIGVNKQNLKRLCWSKPTLQDIIIFIMLIGCFILAWNYNTEIAPYKKIVSDPEGFCVAYYNKIISESLIFLDINQLENNKVIFEFNKSLSNIFIQND